MTNIIIIFICKIFSGLSRLLNLGNGSTWPGHIALKFNNNIINDILKTSQTKTIIIIGTNGKTTTAKLLETILQNNNYKVLVNSSGANLLNGVASALIDACSLNGVLTKDFVIFETDENTLSPIAKKVKPDFIIALNLFRDQLDRYGEIDTIAKNWKKALDILPEATLILNADDPQIAYLGINRKNKTFYFGLNNKILQKTTTQHATDSILCPNCFTKLSFKAYYFSHLGIWQCNKCHFKTPKPNITSLEFYPLMGIYARYNTLAAVLIAKIIGLDKKQISKSLKNFQPAFGRQEKLSYHNKSIQIFLSKNPTSFNQSLTTIIELGGKTVILALNDRIPDGTDVSWIWDVDFETILSKETNVFVTGDRVYDLALRLKYAGFFVHIKDDLKETLDIAVKNLDANETLYVLPTYSAMLEIRKTITGKAIL